MEQETFQIDHTAPEEVLSGILMLHETDRLLWLRVPGNTILERSVLELRPSYSETVFVTFEELDRGLFPRPEDPPSATSFVSAIGSSLRTAFWEDPELLGSKPSKVIVDASLLDTIPRAERALIEQVLKGQLDAAEPGLMRLSKRKWGCLLLLVAARLLSQGSSVALIAPDQALAHPGAKYAESALIETGAIGRVSYLPPLPGCEKHGSLIALGTGYSPNMMEIEDCRRPQGPAMPRRLKVPKRDLEASGSDLSYRFLALTDSRPGASMPLGELASRVPSVAPAAREEAGGVSDDPSMPVRALSPGDFEDGVLRLGTGQYLERLPETPRGSICPLLIPGDILISRATGSLVGTVPDDAAGGAHDFVATENLYALRLKEFDWVSSEAIARYIATGANGQIDALRSTSSRSVRFEAVASLAIPLALVAGTEEYAAVREELTGVALSSNAALASLQSAAASYRDARAEMDLKVLGAARGDVG